MIFKKSIFIFSFFIILTSCNYRLFVDKRYIVQEQKGYLVFNQNQVIFFPTKVTIDMEFFSDKHMGEGYSVEFRTAWLKTLSTDYSNLLFIKNDKNLSVIPVAITSYLGSMWQKEDEQNTVDYKLDGVAHTLRYKQHDWRQILFISVVREIDKRRLDTLKIDPPIPSHHWE